MSSGKGRVQVSMRPSSVIANVLMVGTAGSAFVLEAEHEQGAATLSRALSCEACYGGMGKTSGSRDRTSKVKEALSQVSRDSSGGGCRQHRGAATPRRGTTCQQVQSRAAPPRPTCTTTTPNLRS